MKTVRVVMIGVITALVLGMIGVGTPPTFAQEIEPIWSSDVTVTQPASVSLGAHKPEHFSNVAGSAGIQARWLWYAIPDRRLHLSFFAIVPGTETMTLQVGDLELILEPGNASYGWDDVAVDWEIGQTLAARVVRTSDLMIGAPATGKPTISGTARVGEMLMAHTSAIADEDGLTDVTFSYQWVSNGESDYMEISGETSSTYRIVAADVGKAIKLRVSFTDDAENEEALISEPTATVVPAPNIMPTGLPTTSGTARVHGTLTANTSGIADANGLVDVYFSYQWIRNDGNTDAEIVGATSEAYTMVAADVGKAIKVQVSFTDNGGNDESLTSEPTATVVPAPNVTPTGQPTISGTAWVDETLTADTSDIADANGLAEVSFRFQWIRNDGNTDAEIAGATSNTYTMIAADVSKTIKVQVSFTDNGGNNETLTSALTAEVTVRPNTYATGAPAITGTVSVDETLTANTSGISDIDGLVNVSFRYQWIRNDGNTDTDILDARGLTYRLVSADEGKRIKVRVSFTDDRENEEALTSTPTAPVVAGIRPALPESVQVSTGASQELVVSWEAPSAGPSATGYKVQWKDGTQEYDGSANSARQGVLSAATMLSYTITGLTNGTEYTVRVFAYNASGDSTTSTEVVATPEAPNIIVIFVDDIGYADIGFSASSLGLTSDIATPNLDRLADEGITFTNGYSTSPVCSPARSGLLTGRYPARFGMEANLEYNPFDQSLGLSTEEKLFPTYLRNAGYYTGIVGKWHLGSAQKFTPLERKFEYFYGFLPGSHDYWKIDVSATEDPRMHALMEDRSPATFTGYLTDALTDKAIEFVTEEREQPFFLYLPYNAPHSPYQAPQQLENLVPSHIRDSQRRTYLAMVLSVDQNVGRLLTALEGADKRDNTIIFFLSDHGGLPDGPMNNGSLRDGKGSLYEGGLRIPFVASWPATWPQGHTYEPMVIGMDISATVLDLAKAIVTGGAIDGVNLDPYVRGELTDSPHDALFWRKATPSHKVQVVRWGNMKLYQESTGSPELYDLAQDIREQTNVIRDAKYVGEGQRLAGLWNAWNLNNVKASHIWGISDYRERFRGWLNDHERERTSWVSIQTRQRIRIE